MSPQSLISNENIRLLGANITNNIIDGLIIIELPINTPYTTYYAVFWGDSKGNRLLDLPPLVVSRTGYIRSYALNNLPVPQNARCFLIYIATTNTSKVDSDHIDFDFLSEKKPYVLNLPLR